MYARELRNNEEGDEDEGTVWFSESNAEESVLKQLDDLAEAGLLRKASTEEMPPSRFLDLGTGNGHMLFRLREPEDDDEECWCGDMVGVDYSEASVNLACRIATQRRDTMREGTGSLRFECWDLLESGPGDWLQDGFDAVLDKGTFDAISLMHGETGSMQPCARYREKVAPLLRPGSFLVITSCNWTREELQRWLSPPGSELSFFAEAKYPTFTFGGQIGQSIVTLVFRRKSG